MSKLDLSIETSLIVPARRVISEFSPVQILSNITHWYRADAANVTLDGSNNVSQWNDLVGTAHLTQGSAGNRPAYNPADASYNNQPTIQSTTTTQWLANTSVVTNQVFSVWFVAEFSTVNGTIVGFVPSTSVQPTIFRSSGFVAIYGGTALLSTVGASAKHATLATFNAASSFVGADNWLSGGTVGATGAANGTALSVLAYSNGGNGSIAKIAEVIIQSGVPTVSEKNNMALYFSRYGITVS